jgi:hypothetical protein
VLVIVRLRPEVFAKQVPSDVLSQLSTVDERMVVVEAGVGY